ncbi:MAG: M23 family metallopeptidase [Calditrichia bacterium]
MRAALCIETIGEAVRKCGASHYPLYASAANFLAGSWEFFSDRFKLLYFSFFELILTAGLILKITFTPAQAANIPLVLLFSFVQIYLIYLLIKILIVRNGKDKRRHEIEFPLKNGSYLVTDGGDSRVSRIMNYHYHSPVHKRNKTNLSMIFATDVVKTGNGGARFLPKQNEQYAIFNENLYSPMEGEVIKVVNDIEDNIPFIGKYPYNTGNTVVVRGGKYYFLLGHLRQGSITVKEDEHVKRGDLLGRVGNSGYSERPHLHMQLIESESENYWSGKGVCIQYRGRNLYKNRRIRCPDTFSNAAFL